MKRKEKVKCNTYADFQKNYKKKVAADGEKSQDQNPKREGAPGLLSQLNIQLLISTQVLISGYEFKPWA